MRVIERPVPVVLVLAEHDGRYLLIQEAKEGCRDLWFLPGGRVEAGEDLIAAAKRETLEESGYAVDLQGILYIDQFFNMDAPPAYEGLRFTFAASVTSGTLKSDADEHSLQARWFDPDEIEELPLRTPMVRKWVALHRNGSPILPMSSYDGNTHQWRTREANVSTDDQIQERPVREKIYGHVDQRGYFKS